MKLIRTARLTVGVLLTSLVSGPVWAQETTGSGILTTPLERPTEFIEQWYTCGPFSRTGSPELLQKWAADPGAVAPDSGDFHGERYMTKLGARGWELRSLESVAMASADPLTRKVRSLPTRIINFHSAYPEALIESSAYALALVESSTSESRTLRMGSDDGITVWLNGERIHSVRKERPIVPDEDFVTVSFRPGLNVVLVNVENANGYWGFMMRFADEDAPALLPLPAAGDLLN